ncbi:MAG: pyruvate kinase [Gemmatimonadetes bacterium]|nr:pyruvate kinase [Gemmatimonadota bacterium]
MAAGDVRAGDRILLDDGLIELRVEGVDGTEVVCSVVEGGRLKDRKGINLPGVAVSAPSLTEQDRADARLALELGVDFIALSFVRRASDVLDLRALVEDNGRGTPGIIAKIEKPEALDDIEAILRVSDGIMVARGDLGVELPLEQVPIAQSQLVDVARRAGRPVIVATQMLESMVKNARPTRAEVSDVSTAVLSGADAVMLSAETASGDHPVRAVEMMDRVARQAEGYM